MIITVECDKIKLTIDDGTNASEFSYNKNGIKELIELMSEKSFMLSKIDDDTEDEE